jgi:hypothetical protein
MNTPQNLSFLRGSPSFALISVLALVSLAALSATAFLAAARLERLASRPLADITRLEMASGTGLAMAMGVLAQGGSTNYGLQRIVTYWRTNETDDLGYLLLGIFTNPANSLEISYLPAFSSSLMITNALDPASTQTNASRVTGQGNYRSNAFPGAWTNGLNTNNFTNFPILGNQTSPLVAWIPIRQERRVRPGSAATTNVQVARMAFFVQDLQGLIDAERMGGSNNRTTGTNPAEISLTNLSGTALTNAATASNFVATNMRRLFASVGMLTSSNGGGLATNDLRYVATGLRSWGWAQNNASSFSNRVPPGIQITATSGYSTNAGQVKFDLNTNLTAASLNNLVAVLSNHLPNFTNRAGGFPAGAYFSSLAANIIDYADTDSQPTFLNVAGSEVRGVEALPFVNERVTFFNLIQTNPARVGSVNGIRLTILTQDFYEFWNPHAKATPAVSLSVVASNSLSFTLGFSPPFNFNNPTAATNSAGQAVLSGQTTNTFALPAIPANGFLVTNSLIVTNYFFYPSTNPPPTFPGQYTGNTNFFRYQIYLGTVAPTNLYDRTRVGCFLSANANLPLNTTDTSANRRYFGSYSAFASQTPLGSFRTSTGDPRIMFFLNDNQDQITYATGSSFGGRNLRGNISAANNYREVIISSWPDGGHNSAAGAGAGTLVPTAVTPAIYSNLPPGVITDAGQYTNVLELGNIQDFIQWRDPTFRTTTGFGSETNGGQWAVLTANAIADNRFGGGNTLRIGRPEHPRFAFTNYGGDPVPNMGMSAVALLDLFRIGSADSNNFTGGGKINLNTAPRPVLAALAGGVNLTNDPARAPTNAPTNATMTNSFAQGVLRFRQLYPFYSPSQLAFVSTDYGIGTGWTNTYATTAVFATNAGAGLAGVTALSDAGREEWFSRIYGLSGIDSLNFRCYVVAQLTDVNGNPRGAPYRKYYQIYTAPNPAALTNAALPPFRPVVVEEGSY